MLREISDISVSPAEIVESFEYKGHAIRVLKELHEARIFPSHESNLDTLNTSDPYRFIEAAHFQSFDSKNPKFDAIALLLDIAFWRGYSHERAVTNKDLRIYSSIDNPLEYSTLALLQSIIEKSPFVSKRTEKKKVESLDIPSSYGRFLNLFGFPVGKKKGMKIPFPRHVLVALRMLQGEHADQGENHQARDILRDFVLSFFYAEKVRESKSRGLSGIINGSVHLDVAHERREAFIQAVLNGGFNFDVHTKGQILKRPPRDDLYQTVIRFPGLDQFAVDRFKTEFRGRIYEAIEKTLENA